MIPTTLRIAAIVPCYNEEGAIAKVVADLHAAVPQMDIYVYDNSSTDRTAEVAAAAGAIVRREERKGKGNVVRRAFADVEADVYCMIDGDDTYEAAALPAMIEELLAGPYDHVLGVRQDDTENTHYRPGHEAGNKAFNRLTSKVFGTQVSDMLSGYRVFSRRFVKSFPAMSQAFEIETELTVHAATLRVPQKEYPVAFSDRAAGTESKLNTFSDGFRILGLIARLVSEERPVLFHSVLACLTWLLAIIFGAPVLSHYLADGDVPRFPTLILVIGLLTVGFLWMMLGLILAGQRRNRSIEARLRYLALPSVHEVAMRTASSAADGRTSVTR